MDINRDEIRRQLEESAREQRDALPRWKDALDRTLESDHSEDATAGLLSVPNRRGFLRIGGMTFAGAALMAACTPEPHKTQIAQTGDTPSTPTTQLYEPEGSIATDLLLLRVAQSIEKLAVAAYDAALASTLLPDAVATAVKLFQSQHNEHFALLQGTVRGLGGDSYDEPNPVLKKALVDPAAEAITGGTATLASVLNLAHALEDAAAQTYTNSVSLLTTANLRQALMSIGAVEARHVAVLLGVQKPGNPLLQVPFPFEKTSDAVKERSDAAAAVGTGKEVTSTTAAGRSSTTRRPTTGSSTVGGGGSSLPGSQNTTNAPGSTNTTGL